MHKVYYKLYPIQGSKDRVLIVLARNIALGESFAKIGIAKEGVALTANVLEVKNEGSKFPVDVARTICLGSEKLTVDTAGKSQSQIIIEHLKEFGQITSMEAFGHYDITRLSALIYNFRRKGEIITSVKQTSVRGKNYVKYFYQSK